MTHSLSRRFINNIPDVPNNDFNDKKRGGNGKKEMIISPSFQAIITNFLFSEP